MDTIDLVARIQQGDTDAFSELYDLHVDRIYRFIRLKVTDQSQAEDILQEVFIKAWQGCQTLQLEQLNFSAWLYKVTSNTVNDYFRKKYRTPEIVTIDESIDVAASESLEQQTNTVIDRTRLKEALAELPVQYRQILELRFVQDFTLGETADILGKSNLAVRLQQHRALKKLQHIVQQHLATYGQA